MKELTIEQKAKAYDRAIEIINDYYQKIKYSSLSSASTDREVLERAFPELSESEDERIRGAIIDHLKANNLTEWASWLEKQKTSEKALQYLKENHSPSEVSDFQVAMNIAVAKAYDKGYNDALEKQGEKKSVDEIAKEVCKNKASAVAFLKSTDIMNENGELADEYKIEQGEQKPAITEDKDAEKAAEEYRNFRMFCGIKDPVMLNEIEEAYYEGAIIRQQNPAWSEEDEKIALSIEQVMNCASLLNIVPEKVNKIRTWLKSLKERVLPQPKQEWSEEDESMLYGVMETERYMLDVVNGIKKFDVGNVDIRKACAEELNWLKSLRPQNKWKPSDEQMKALNAINVTGIISDAGQGQVLIELYNDLKKLMEE